MSEPAPQTGPAAGHDAGAGATAAPRAPAEFWEDDFPGLKA